MVEVYGRRRSTPNCKSMCVETETGGLARNALWYHTQRGNQHLVVTPKACAQMLRRNRESGSGMIERVAKGQNKNSKTHLRVIAHMQTRTLRFRRRLRIRAHTTRFRYRRVSASVHRRKQQNISVLYIAGVPKKWLFR